MPQSRRRLDPAVVQPFFELVRAQFAQGAPTIDRAETVIEELFQQLGPDLVEQLLQGALAEEEKGARRSVRAGSPTTGTGTGRAPSPVGGARRTSR